jgi:hypothetical protein
MAEALEIKLPQSFFDALEEIKESSEERNDNRSDSDFYAKNILNGGNIQKVAPTFTSQLAKGYEDIGAAIFKGGTKIFFEYWDKIKKQEEYKKVDKSPAKQINPIINVNLPKEKVPKLPPTGSLSNLALLALLLLGLAGRTGPLGQIVESIAYLPEALKGLVGTKWVKSIIEKIKEPLKAFKNGLKAIPKFFESFGKLGNFIGKTIGRLSKITGNIFSLLGKTGIGIITKTVGPFLKKLPLIGTVMSLYQAYLRYNEGNYSQAIMELFAGILPFFGPVGAGVAIGINVLQMLWDGNVGGSGVAKAALKGGVTLARNFISMFPKTLVKLLKPVSTALRRIPIFGGLIGLGFAINDFKNGNNLSGALNLVSGIATFLDLLIPGLGTGIAIGIDAINYWVNNTESGKNFTNNTSDWLGKAWAWMKDLSKYIWDGILAGYKWLEDILGKAWQGIKSFFNDIINWYKDAFKIIGKKLDDTWNFILGSIKKSISNTIDTVKSGFDKITETFNTVKGFVNDKIIRPFKSLVNHVLIPVLKLKDKIIGTNTAEEYQKSLNQFSTEIKSVSDLDTQQLKALQIARTEAFKKFGIDSLNDSSKKYKEAMKYIKARQAELNNTSADSLNKIQSDLEKSSTTTVIDKRLEKANINTKIELENTKTTLDAQKISLQEALKKNNLQTNNIATDQATYMNKLLSGIDRLIDTVKDKPVAFANLNMPQVNVNNIGNGGSYQGASDPRYGYRY